MNFIMIGLLLREALDRLRVRLNVNEWMDEWMNTSIYIAPIRQSPQIWGATAAEEMTFEYLVVCPMHCIAALDQWYFSYEIHLSYSLS